MTIRPMNDQVLVELEPLELTTPGGLHIPEPAAYKQDNRPDVRFGKVLGVGPRCKLGLMTGNRVMLNAWLNDAARPGGGYGGVDASDSLVFIQEKDIFGVDEG
jgi:co-chaperonin GroES (HSP10)